MDIMKTRIKEDNSYQCTAKRFLAKFLKHLKDQHTAKKTF